MLALIVTIFGRRTVAQITSANGVTDVFSSVFDKMKMFSGPMDAQSAFKSVNQFVGDFAPVEGARGCEHGRLRFTGACVVDKYSKPIFDICPDGCLIDPMMSTCRCHIPVKHRFVCPPGFGPEDSPRDYIVTLTNKGGERELKVRPVDESEIIKRLPKMSKLAKMCLELHVGLSNPVCPPDHPLKDDENCFRVVSRPPKINLTRLKTSHSDPTVTVSDVDYSCVHAEKQWLGHELSCHCSWSEQSTPAFHCPTPFSRTDGLGDFYSFTQMIKAKSDDPDHFPLRLCHATEYVSQSCETAGLSGPPKLDDRPHLNFGEWTPNHGRSDACTRDLWYPPTKPFCPKKGARYEAVTTPVDTEGSEMLRNLKNVCVWDTDEHGSGYCQGNPDLEAKFDEQDQLCHHKEYTSALEMTCDPIFSAPPRYVIDEGTRALILNERDGPTCVSSRFVPAIDDCATSSCTEEVTYQASPRCPKGQKLVEHLSPLKGKGDHSDEQASKLPPVPYCVEKIIKKKSQGQMSPNPAMPDTVAYY